jgi:multicomponent Na+:H+ antiporter subunit G
MMDYVIAGIVLAGALFGLIGSIGVLRMPDLFLRTSAATKGSTFGLGLTLLGVALALESLDTTTKCIAVIAFVFLTAPIAAHMITRAAYMDNAPLWSRTVVNELGNRDDSDPTEQASRRTP